MVRRAMAGWRTQEAQEIHGNVSKADRVDALARLEAAVDKVGS